MPTFCIDKPVAQKMKDAVKSGEINIQKLYDMTSAERRGVFEKYSSTDLAKHINAAFENAMVSKQKGTLKKWAESVFTPSQKQSANYKNVLDKINDLDKLGVLNTQNSNSFMEDLVAEKLGVSVTPAEVKEITTRAKKLETLFNQDTNDGLPPVEYWVERKGMENYLNSLVPSSSLKVATSIAGRGAMLFSIKSPITNIISNTVQGAVQAFERRIASNTYKGLNGDFALEYVKKVNDIYQKSGYDISRMESFSQGQRRLGEEIISSQGPGAVRAIGRWYEDIVFKQLMGAPDAASSSIAFADSANLASTKIAKGDKAKALEIFKDAIQIKPKTLNGEIVRSQAIADAQYSTYTNKGGFSDLAMAIRSALNKATGDIRLGDQLMPFVKTPANVVQAGIDSAGVGAFRGFFKLPEAIRQAKDGNGKPMRDTVRLFIRSGLGFTLSTVLAYMVNPDDFVGDYDSLSQKERNLTQLKNAPYNSVKIRDKYISLDYFGPLASAFVGILYARKYGDTLPEKIYQYGRGATGQALRLPGLREFTDIVSNINRAVQKGDLGDVGKGLTDEAVGYIRARTVPAIVNDFAKGIDPYERQTGQSQLSKTQASIPGLRQQLPEKISQVTGEPIKSEGLISTLLFGSRVKTAQSNELTKEIQRLYKTDTGPTITDIARSSKRVKELKNQIPDEEFQDALKFYGKRYGLYTNMRMKTVSYKKANDDEKKRMLDKIRNESVDKMLKKYGYKKS